MSDKNNSDLEGFPFEKYRLTLTHEYVDVEGKTHKLDPPLAVQCVVESYFRGHHFVLINEMLERMRYAILDQAKTNLVNGPEQKGD